jgi:hypothetical protein
MLTVEQAHLVKARVHEIIKTREACCLCGARFYQVDIFYTINTRRRMKVLHVVSLCERCANSPGLNTRKVEMDFAAMQDVCKDTAGEALQGC